MRPRETLLAALGALCLAGAADAAAGARPNVVIILTDDQGFGDMGFAGNPVVRTPHIDAFLAMPNGRAGAMFVELARLAVRRGPL